MLGCRVCESRFGCLDVTVCGCACHDWDTLVELLGSGPTSWSPSHICAASFKLRTACVNTFLRSMMLPISKYSSAVASPDRMRSPICFALSSRAHGRTRARAGVGFRVGGARSVECEAKKSLYGRGFGAKDAGFRVQGSGFRV